VDGGADRGELEGVVGGGGVGFEIDVYAVRLHSSVYYVRKTLENEWQLQSSRNDFTGKLDSTLIVIPTPIEIKIEQLLDRGFYWEEYYCHGAAHQDIGHNCALGAVECKREQIDQARKHGPGGGESCYVNNSAPQDDPHFQQVMP
jgi:hypothetical protein